jgi:hypothetical protein
LCLIFRTAQAAVEAYATGTLSVCAAVHTGFWSALHASADCSRCCNQASRPANRESSPHQRRSAPLTVSSSAR